MTGTGVFHNRQLMREPFPDRCKSFTDNRLNVRWYILCLLRSELYSFRHNPLYLMYSYELRTIPKIDRPSPRAESSGN